MYQKCPVCEGRKSVPPGFYFDAASSSESRETCKTCMGSGVIRDDITPVVIPSKYPAMDAQ
jgi:hypothetical protein